MGVVDDEDDCDDDGGGAKEKKKKKAGLKIEESCGLTDWLTALEGLFKHT